MDRASFVLVGKRKSPLTMLHAIRSGLLPLQAARLATLFVMTGICPRGAAADNENASALPPAPVPVIISGAGSARLRVEALNEQVVRIWYKPDGDFSRLQSQALAEPPLARAPLALRENAGEVILSTGALTVRIDRATLQFDVATRGDNTPLLSRTRVTAKPDSTAWTLTHQLGNDERLFGLGEDNQNTGRLNRRGTLRDLWAGQKINSGNVTAQYPIPLLLSTGRNGHAYGVFYDNAQELRFDLAKSVPDEVRCDGPGGEIDLYVINGPRLAQVVERYAQLTGTPSLPPLWALGYWQSKCTFRDWPEIDETYQQLAQRGFPVDVMVIDADWPEIVNDYVWAKRWFGPGYTPASKIAEYARRGIRIVMSQSGPMIRRESPAFLAGWKAGVFATDGHGHPVETGYYGGELLDFTHPGLNAWLWPQARKLNEQGSSGWWLDLTEPEGEPPQATYHGGNSANVHNEFSLLCTRSYEGVQLAVHPDQRPFVLTRCGPAGLQRFQAAVWTGDINSDYATLRSHPPEMLNSGLSGFTWWTCDTGGFLSGYYKDDQFGAHARLYERWMQFSVFSPITRTHKAGIPQPYAFGPATEQGARHYLELRYRLLPYIYSYAYIASRTGLPLVRPLALEYPDDPGSVDAAGDEYLFGRELLVAPVLHEGVTNRSVYFPPGQWYDWDTGCEYTGGRTWVVAAPQNRIPVAVRAGAIIPMAPFMRNTAEKPWDPLTVEIYPSGRDAFTLYRDDGVSFAYRKGDSTTTKFTCDTRAQAIRFAIGESNKRYAPHVYALQFHLNQTPKAVTLGSITLTQATNGVTPASGQWSWDASRRVLAVKIDNTAATTHTVDVALDGVALPVRPPPALTADPIDVNGESTVALRPTPHFFPAPDLPVRLKAVNYDNGGEGIAFHVTPGNSTTGRYRADDIGCVACDDAGGGYALAGLRADEWARYSVNSGNGGYFDIAARIKGAGQFHLIVDGQTIAVFDAAKADADAGWREVVASNVYLNPGETSLMLFVDREGFSLNGFDFRVSESPPRVYDAALAFRAGTTELRSLGGGFQGHGTLGGLGRLGSSVTFGLSGLPDGKATARLFYRNGLAKPVSLSFAIDASPAQPLALPPTKGDSWQPFDLPTPLTPGTHRLVLRGQEDGWDSVQLDHVEVVVR
jgi:alpha-glucosidase